MQTKEDVMNDLPMRGRVALVAGASKGIGAATAEAFAAAGAAVVLGARDLAALETVASRIEAKGGRALPVRTDVADADSMRGLVERVVATYGRLDAAFNNATDGPLPAQLADIDPAEFDRGVANLAAYVAGKAGIIGLTKVAALDYADHGIRVNVVAPGTILTYHLEAAGAEAQRQAGLATPMRRIGTVTEVAETVL